VRRRTARVAVGVLAAVLALGVLAQLVLFPAINRRAVKVDWSDTLKAGDPANLPATMQVFTARARTFPVCTPKAADSGRKS